MILRIGSLCSGYGGLDLGVELVFPDARPAWFVEYDKDPSSILAHHWPDVPNHGDVKHTDWSTVEPVDILTAGYPCQPFSHAGKRKGADDPRHLWPDVARAIGALRPRLVVLENVAGHVSLGLADVLGALSQMGYDATWGVVRAADAGAPHGRARIFIVATPDTDDRGRLGWWSDDAGGSGHRPRRLGRSAGTGADAADSSRDGHGPRQDAGGVGRLDGPDAPQARERQRARAIPGNRGASAPADASRDGRDEGRPEPARLVGRPDAAQRGDTDWGDYGPAIRRWQRVLGRPAPAPTEPGRTGHRLSPRFVEWLMGLPAGHVTDPAIGLSRNAQLKALGNGVVPAQAALAIRTLLAIHEQEMAA